MNLVRVCALTISLTILLYSGTVVSLDKNLFCDCRLLNDDARLETINGVKNPQFVNYIVSLGKLPFSLDFFTDKHKVETHLCSGVIMNEKWILSTASCLTTESDIKKVGVGLNNKQNDLIAIYDDGRIPIKSTKIHEAYNATTLENDIAIVELTESIDFRRTRFRPICLLHKNQFWFNMMNNFNWGNIRDLKRPVLNPADLKYLRYLKETSAIRWTTVWDSQRDSACDRPSNRI